MIDPKIAEAAFALKKDELSKPVEGQFAIVLVRVSEIVPGKQRSFDEVKGEVRDKLAEERTNQEIQSLHDKVEDERASGKPLKEIAEQLKLDFREIPDIDRGGKTADGKPAIEGAAAAQVAQAAFAGSPGLDAEATELADGGYAWVDVVAVTPEKQKTFEEAKAEITTAATEEQRRAEIASLAGKLVDRLGKGEIDRCGRQGGRRSQGAEGHRRDAQHGAAGPDPGRGPAGLRAAEGRGGLGADGRRQVAHHPARRRHQACPLPQRPSSSPASRPRSRARCRATSSANISTPCRSATACRSTRRLCARRWAPAAQQDIE